MFNCELIVGTGASTVSLDLNDELPLSVNLSIAEIQDISKRNGDFSKTIKLKGSKVNNKFFEETYDVNIKTSTWNPNIKVPAFFREASEKPLKGDIRLLRIEVYDQNAIDGIVYEVNILGRNDTLLTAIGDDKLENLNLSTYNHNFTYAKQNAAESNTIDVAGVPTVVANGVGYRYPLVDYGYNGFASNYYHVNHLRPAIFAWTYWNAIFTAAGKTYTSVFLDDVNDLFRRDLILHNGEKLVMSAATQATRECYVGNTGAIASQTKALQSTGSTFNDWWTGDLFNSTSASYTMKYNDDSTLPFIDTGNIYNTGTGILTLAATGIYNLTFVSNFEIKLATVPAGTVTVNQSVNGKWTISYKVLRSTDGGATWNIILNDTPNFQTTLLSTAYQTFNKTINVPTSTFNSGDQFRLLVHPLYSASGYGLVFKDGVGTPITAGTASIEWRFKNTAVFNCKLPSAEITEGLPLVINDCIPKDVKQKDFILHFIKKYNLYVDVDPDDPDNYIIEPRDDFYALGSTKDWTSKYAINKPRIVEPMGALDWKIFTLSYKQDQDYYNKVYQDSYTEAYGTHRETIVNDFLKNELKNELIFSATPVVDNPFNDLIIPKIFAFDGTTVKPMKHNIRTVLWRGSVSMTNTWTYGSTSGNVTKTSYQGCAMADNPLAATETTEFGVPNELYYSGIGVTYTTNNLFNRFYSKQISQIVHRDSKLVTMFLKLEPYDIATFDFRDKIWIHDSFYYVNKIMDYNPLTPGLTKVEFLKIVSGDTYTPVVGVGLGDLSTNRGYVGVKVSPFGMPVESLSPISSNRVGVGTNNISESEGTLIAGDSNRIGTGSETSNIVGSKFSSIGNNVLNSALINCVNCAIGDYCDNVTLISCVDYTVDETVSEFLASFKNGETITISDNGTVRMGNAISNTKVRTATVTANFNVDPNIDIYYVDCSGANILATFDMTTALDKVITFKRIDGVIANTFSIDEISGLAVFDGAATPYNTAMVQWQTLKVTTDGTDLFSV
jgi:hypothetical protein